MKKIITPILLLAVYLFQPTDLFSEKSPKKFGEIDIKMLKSTQAPIDSTAGAFYIFDYGYATYDHNFEISLERHVRIKILNSTAFDLGDISIPYSADDQVERLKAASYNLENGEIIETKFSKKDAFVEKVNDKFNRKKFSIPNVKEGSIIEYTYRVNYGSWRSLSSWYFQKDYPNLHSEYIVKLPEYFYYKQLMVGYLAVDVVDKTAENNIYSGQTFTVNKDRYVMKNIPAFKEEPFLSSSDNYISKIKYELKSINIPGSVIQTSMQDSYLLLSKAIANEEYYGKSLENNNYLDDLAQQITAQAETNEEKIKKLYEYVRDTFEIDYDVMAEGLRRVFKLKRGFRNDITRALVSLARQSGFESHIVRLSTRSNGRLHPVYPVSSQFDYSLAYIEADGVEYLLDPTIKSLPFNQLPFKCLNGRGLLISKSQPRWVDLSPKDQYEETIFGSLELTSEGLLTGQLDVLTKGYSAYSLKSTYQNKVSEYKETIEKNKPDWFIEEHTISGMDDIDADVKEHLELEIEDAVEDIGNLIYFKPIIYGSILENPFKQENRSYPVEFGAKRKKSATYRIKLPEGYLVDEMPKSVAIGLPNNAGSFIYNTQLSGGYLIITSKFNIKSTSISTEEYPYLREFYTLVSSKFSEQVVLKKEI